jgi:shikimate dehydrogenase
VIRGSTRLAAVIGWPIAHSRSPQLINAAFAAAAIDAVMIPIGVPPEGFATVVAGLHGMRALGASVTLPHKLAAVALCDELSADAHAIGAVNCLHVDGARLVGHNTDAAGFIDGLAAAGLDVAGKRAVVLGAGGAARAVVHGLASVGARAQVIARAPAAVGWTQALPWSTAQLRDAFAGAELVVDCTPIALGEGEAEAVAALPLDALAAGAWVATLVYHRATILLERARARGHSTVDGRAMLVHQGARAFTLWTGCPAPVARMAEALDASLLDSC